jgi:adenylyl-sulfate kinase
MTLVSDRHTSTVPLGDLPDVTLTPALVHDLLLGLAGVLPRGHELGGPVLEEDGDLVPGRAGEVTLALAGPEAARRAVAGGALVLRDQEHTPLAVLEGVVRVAGSDVAVAGLPRPVRARESRAASHPEVDFDLEHLHHRPVLVMARPATTADVQDLAEWAAAVGAPPVVLVAEQSERHDRVGTATLVRLAAALVAELDSRAEVLTVPLEGRDHHSDTRLAHRVAARLRAADVRLLLDDAPTDTADAWRRARSALLEGHDDDTPLEDFPATTHDLLHAWRLPRSRRGLVVMFTGLSGSGKSTLARDVADWVATHSSRTVTLLDGDRVRQLLSAGLGFDEASRELNVRRIGYVAAEVARHGGIAICSPIAPAATVRAEVREMAECVGDFLLVHVATPLEECERRDLKGLYAAARRGTVPHFTGISAPYDVPVDADLRVDTSLVERPRAARLVLDTLIDGGWLSEDRS